MDTIYKEKSKEELDLLVANFRNLTIDSKRSLLHFLNENQEYQSAEMDLSLLVSDIEKEQSLVEELFYLKNLGFDLEKHGDQLKLKRSKQAKNMDLFTLIFGAILGLMLPWSLYGWYWLYNQPEIDFGVGFVNLINMVLGVVGLMLVMKSANRIEKYWSLLLLLSPNQLTVSKNGVNVMYVSRVEDVILDENEDSVKLYVKSGSKEQDLIPIQKPNLYFRQTVQKLKELIDNQLQK